ncbi:M48 family metalloprotease [bacterium]|nr:M48 family metalloprotease [bacterium]
MILLRLCLVYYVSRHRVPVGSEVLEIFDRAMRRLGYSGSCRVWVSSGTLGPFAFGTFRPTVMVPVQMMDSFSKDESELVFAHEIAHLRNQDSLWQPLINLVTLIFWWHPAVWWGRRNLLNAGEFAADARVVNAALNPVSLAECLIKFGHRVWARNRLSLLFQNGAAFHSALGKRIERLLKRPAPEEDLREIRRIGISSGSVVLIASCYFAVSRMVFPGLADANSLGETILAAAEPAEVVPIPIESVAVDSTEQDEKGLREGLESLASESSERDLLGEELVEEEKKAVNEVGGLTPAEYERFSKKSEIELLSMPSRVTRRFRLDPERAKDAFARFSNSSPDDFHDVRSDLQSKIRAVFRGAGINIPKSDEILDDQSHSFIFYNQENGLLFTRVLPSELDRLAEIVASINESPPQVFLDVRIAEVRDKSRQMLEERFPGFVGGGTTDSDALPQRTIDESLSSAISETLMGFSDCDLLAAPRVTTLSGRAAEISTTESRTIVFPERFEGSDEAPLLLDEPNDLAVRMKDGVVLTREVRVGLTTRILPSVRVSGNEVLIDLDVSFLLREFLGYDDPGPSVVVGEDEPSDRQTPLPRFRHREAKTSATILDGQTLMLSSMGSTNIRKMKKRVPVIGSIPLIGRLFRSEKTEQIESHLIVFVTATLIDPAGNRLYPPRKSK